MGGFGAYGKLPGLGDFFHFDLGRAFVENWDRWLQDRLAGARLSLGEAWQDRYLSAPIWRFSLTAGLAGPDAMLGVLMPSVDRVGRHFPLTLASALPAGASALHEHFSARQTFEALEALALSALDGEADPERLRDGLASVPPTPLLLVRPELSETAARLTMICPSGEVADALAAERGGSGRRAPSAWSCLGPDDRRLMVVEGLPGPEEALGLFDLGAPIWARVATSAA